MSAINHLQPQKIGASYRGRKPYRGKMKLTDANCKMMQPKEKPYKRADGYGLYIEILPHGSKLWRLKYRYLGRENRLSLGSYPSVTLAQAREQRDVARKQLKAGIDPSSLRKAEKKNRPKPYSNKNVFNLSLSDRGILTIETASRIIHLTATQTETLRSFLKAASSSKTKGKKT